MGVVSLGIRLRHDIFDRWLRKPTNVNQVIKELGEAFFDPEFSPNYLTEIQSEWELKQPSFALTD